MYAYLFTTMDKHKSQKDSSNMQLHRDFAYDIYIEKQWNLLYPCVNHLSVCTNFMSFAIAIPTLKW